MRRRKAYGITTRGVGRPDYSSAVEKLPVSVVSKYQNLAYYTHTFDNIPSGGTAEHITETFDYSHFVSDILAYASANVAFRLYIYGYNEKTKEWVLTLYLEGIQYITTKLGTYYPFSKMKIVAENFGDVDIKVLYNHIGIKGIERIYPIMRLWE